MPPSEDEPSIRAYRARKNRPCDNCRSRRRRCLITAVGTPCSLCVQTKKACTFLRDRPAVRAPMEGAVNEPSASASHGPASAGAVGDPITLDASAPQRLPVLDTSPSSATNRRPMDAASLIKMVRHTRQGPRYMHNTSVGHALDDEARDDEELYLVGTAVEKDALVLHQLALEESGQVTSNGTSGIRVRVVSPTVSFVFYRSSPYDFDNSSTDGVFAQVKGLMDDRTASEILDRFHSIEGQGLPIFSPHQQPNDCLKAFQLTAGLIYTPSLRGHHKSAYVATMNKVYLLDLNGREAINPSGNFITLGQAISIACLLGLNEDCSSWSIPEWEKDLRQRLWWALEVYDVFSALSFGRTRTILFGRNAPPPSRATGNISLTAFAFLCELAIILDRMHTDKRDGHLLDSLSEAAASLDNWRASLDSSGILVSRTSDSQHAPGVRSLYLAYLGVSLTIVKEVWNVTGNEYEIGAQCRETCLRTCIDIVDFISSLDGADLGGYWASYCPFMLSFCLTLLVRLILASDRQDQSDDSVWQIALFQLRRFITALTKARNESQWDVADLALSRASHFIPLLARRTSEIQVALLPLGLDTGNGSSGLFMPPETGEMDDFFASLLQPDDTSIPAFPDIDFDWLNSLAMPHA